MPEPDQRGTGKDYEAPRDGIERILAEIWGEVLRLERVGVEDDFFALGGHSLSATKILARLRDLFQIDVGRHLDLAAVDLEDLHPPEDVREVDLDLAVESARAGQRRVEHVRAVGRGQQHAIE